MQTFDDVARLAAGLPQVTEGVDKFRKTSRTWDVAGKSFAWERPFSKADIKRFGDQRPPDGPILAAHPAAFFTIPHFNGFSAYLVQLDKVTPAELSEALTDGWLAVAPRDLADRFAAGERTSESEDG